MHIIMVNLHADIWSKLRRKENWNKFIREEWKIDSVQRPNFINVMSELTSKGHVAISGTETGDLNFSKAIYNFCHNVGIVCSSTQQNMILSRVAGPGTRGEYSQDINIYMYFNIAHDSYIPPVLGSMLAFNRELNYWKDHAKRNAQSLITQYSEVLEGVKDA